LLILLLLRLEMLLEVVSFYALLTSAILFVKTLYKTVGSGILKLLYEVGARFKTSGAIIIETNASSLLTAFLY
jgi:hypothetical protein